LRFATVTIIGSGWLLSSNKILPMSGTLGQVGNRLSTCGRLVIGLQKSKGNALNGHHSPGSRSEAFLNPMGRCLT
jgi:hypothetical protein